MAKRPAYAVEAWFTGQKGVGPQCSANDEFCFFCEFSEGQDECGHVAELKAMVRLLVEQKKELSTIVGAVQEVYRERIQDDVEVRGPTGRTLVHPEWSRSSISRHLAYSTEFPAIFKAVVTQIHQSIIMKLNQECISGTEIDTEKLDELRKTVASLARWQR